MIMRTKIPFFILLTIVLWVFTANAQVIDTVTVTFNINTATVPDTLRPTSTVQVRGNTLPLTWDYLSGVRAVNIGGDYWVATAKFPLYRDSTLTIQYKFFTNSNPTVTSADNQSWESNLNNPGTNRLLTIGPYTGNKDTTIALQYVNAKSTQDQWWKPYVLSNDSVAVMFRVNMQANEGFSKSAMKMGVRGGLAPLSWSSSFILTKEAVHGNGCNYDGTNFWSGVVKFPKTAATGDVFYKFVIHNLPDAPTADPTWEGPIAAAPDVQISGDPNRFFYFDPAMPDTTLYWKWWNNQGIKPFSGTDVVSITFRVDMTKAIAENGFKIGDTIIVRSGYSGSAAAMRDKRLTRVGLSSFYQGTDAVTTKFNTPLYYQYYRTSYTGETREVYYNFADPGSSATSEKRRFVTTVTPVTIRDTVLSASDERRMPRFRNLKKLQQNVLTTYTCDIRPAIYQLKKGSQLAATNITNYVISDPDSVILYGLWMNGPAVGGWDIGGAWGVDRRAKDTCKMWDDGTHGDVTAGDSIYTLQWADTTNGVIGKEFKFGIYGCDNEGGYGNNHIENISDVNPTYTVASQFGSIDPLFYDAWDYTNQQPTGIGMEVTNLPSAYSLGQNYPNPFNPSTRIDYEIKTAGVVTLKVFNILGQLAATLVDSKQEAGKHFVIFDASRFSSGLYLYQITSGKFSDTKKMILVK
jgi:hypothetical protein